MGRPKVDRAPVGTGQEEECPRSYRVLVVDDDPAVLRSLQRALRKQDVMTARNGSEALQILSEDPTFDVILCDLMMPEITGMEVYERLRELKGGLERRMIFLSGAIFSEPVRVFLRAVPNLRFEKPIDSELLRAVLAQASKVPRRT
jgi:two-component system, NtrC family, sensor kinase